MIIPFKQTLQHYISIVINLFTGNCLVIAAVLCSSKLRSVTNLFIVSLAVADLLVGVAVLPFSATREVFKVGSFNYLTKAEGLMHMQKTTPKTTGETVLDISCVIFDNTNHKIGFSVKFLVLKNFF
ncbi:unnamed protein product [Euphydryas editha]|uniref:G-protein coupled receptors family 1 profile domain-containing protein n=1 Tax=Euphydryas editha TaxID=104508 RepID=A0AAU9UHQ6_EUPED|nr:unnamed protein product [Euphydryas editha]